MDGGGVGMRYFKQFDESGRIIAIGTGPGGVEITEAEYNAILDEVREKVVYVEKLIMGEITIDDVPEAWREDVQYEVDAIKAEEEAAQQDISAEEALNIILGGETT